MKILIIDDDPHFMNSMVLYLEDLEHTVIAAERGEEGLKKVEETNPDIILVDLNMPGMNGHEVLEIVKSQTPDTPTIMISGTGQIQDALDAMKKGAWDFITKPILDLNMLTHAIGKVMDRAELIRKNREYQEQLLANNDLLEEKVAQRTMELHQAKIAAEAANEAKSEFLANITHELRTPLHGILNFADLGIERIERYDAEKQLDFLKEIYKSGERLLTLINNLLDLARLDSGQIRYEFSYQPLGSVVETVLKEYTHVGEEKQILIDYEKPDFDDTAAFDFKRIEQVTKNLIDNALRFSPASSKVKIRISGDDKNLTLAVSDQGVGIPESELTRIFEKFTQSSKTDDGSGGTGLGLPIAQLIMFDHKGIIQAENNPDLGTTVSITLPKQYMVKKKLGEILLEEKVISKGTLNRMLEKQEGH